MMSILSRFIELFTMVMAPLWNYPERMYQMSRWLMRILLFAVVLTILVWLSQRPVFILKHIQIEPLPEQTLKHINLPLVRNQALEKVQGNFFSVRLDEVKLAFETLPWVRHASVRRVWPNGLAITLEEQKPLGVWGKPDNQKLINIYGEVFAGSVAEVDDEIRLIEFSGPEGSGKEVLRLYQKSNQWFKSWDTQVSVLTLSDRYAWNVKLNNGLRIEFGRDEDSQNQTLTDERVAQLIQFWPQVQEKWPNRVDAIDLRYGNGFAVHLMAANTKNSNEVKGEQKR
ncbi:MAG: cell division protein FtsQ/DivIB [Polynucleobacter sp.]|jgi:cell division protein FtsQ|nr:cell division protein FtsQ/DivIB [Polynucleobacter sp.]